MERPKNLKVGDKFVVQDERMQCDVECKVGDIITLDLDDNTDTPRFKFPDGRSYYYQFIGIKPYDECSSITRFGGRIDGNTVTVHIGKSTGTAKYNPKDEKCGLPFRPEVGVALAYGRAAGMSAEDVQKLSGALLHTEFNLRQLVAQKIKESGKIPAIKLYREKTGCGLRESKEYVDGIEAEASALDPNRPFKVGDLVTGAVSIQWLKNLVCRITAITSDGKYKLREIKRLNKELVGDPSCAEWEESELKHYDDSVPSKAAFVPHLEQRGLAVGTIGEDAGFTDLIGHPLKVGDTVDLYNSERLDYKKEEPVIKEPDGTFGIANVSGRGYKWISGKASEESWKIIKRRSPDQVRDGEEFGNGVKYIKEEQE